MAKSPPTFHHQVKVSHTNTTPAKSPAWLSMLSKVPLRSGRGLWHGNPPVQTDLILFSWLMNVVLSTSCNGSPAVRLLVLETVCLEKMKRLIFLEKSPPEAKELPWFTVYYYFSANPHEAQLTSKKRPEWAGSTHMVSKPCHRTS